MAWSAIDSLAFTAEDRGGYGFMVIPTVPGVIAFGVSVSIPISQKSVRRRAAFAYPFVGLDGRQLMGPSLELFAALEGQPDAIHLCPFDWLQAYTGLAGRVEAYAVAVAMDRGAFPASATLWALT